MQDLQNTMIESPEKLELFVLCPGLSKEEVTVSFDKKEGILEIQGVPNKSSLSEAVELNIKGKVSISPKYRSENIDATVEDGVLTVAFGLAKDVNLVDVK